jgi:hypothetical protein
MVDGRRLRYDLKWTLIGEPFLTPRGALVDAVTAAVQAVAGGLRGGHLPSRSPFNRDLRQKSWKLDCF